SEYLLNQSVIKNSNPFLVSLGQQGREFLDYLLEENAADIDVFVKPGSLTLLNALQQDILDDFDREEGDRLLLLDDSIRVHICHSQMREIEVLYDCLLDLIERHDIYPADIIVMAPDIESYAPYIEAVFGNAPQNRKLPYQIVDRLPIGDRRIIDSFLWLMSLPRHRFEIEEILSLLENPAIARKFDLEPLDRDQIEKWVASLRICWGLDAQHRLDLGLPGYSEHTWRWGIERMLLGFAMPVNGLYASRLPYVEIEGQSAVILGKLCAFLEKLSNWRHILSQAYSVNKWEPTLYKLLEDFFDCPDEQIVIFEHMRMRIENFFESARLSGYSGDVSHVFLCGALSGRLSDVAAYGFLHGGVTFCSMISMRSVPFRVVYLLGLNDAGYPHRDKNVDFDLVAQSRKAGDWSRRNDDCYQFLESIISARDHFYISYVGRDIRDNSVLSPSPLVSNLMIILNKGYIKCENDVNPVVVHHPLKPYSPEYFIGQKNLFSYSEAMCRASKGKRLLTAPTPFFEFKHVAYE
ncbi:MAG: exodeoxyribonuclease V subunit gamma, partial [Pseudomonadota bacterium]|nr:exodeoxyribonuclease V subunit gamma [Pseudomonadota bacterium]